MLKKKSNIFKIEKKNLPTSYLRDKNVIYSNILNNIKKQYVIISVKKKSSMLLLGGGPTPKCCVWKRDSQKREREELS